MAEVVSFITAETRGPLPTRGRRGLLVEAAPDGPLVRGAPSTLTFTDLVGDVEEAKHEAFLLAERLLDDEPRFRGIAQLRVFEELVIHALKRALLCLRLDETLREMGAKECRFPVPDSWSDGLRTLAATHGAPYSVEFAQTALHPSLPRRILTRLSTAGFSKQALAFEAQLALERLDPYELYRNAFDREAPRFPHQQIWFYGTALNCTRIGIAYQELLGQEVHYLLDNPHDAGRPLRARGTPYVDIWKLATRAKVPSTTEVAEAWHGIETHLRSVSLSSREQLARELLLHDDFVGLFRNRLLARGLVLSQLGREFVALAEPRGLAVGNPLHEAYLLHAAKAAGVPTVTLQHGVLGNYWQFHDPPGDHHIVRGEFWKRFLNPDSRKKCLVLNHPGGERADATPAVSDRPFVVLLTYPYKLSNLQTHHTAGVEEVLGAVARAVAKTDATLVVRVHPAEKVGVYRQMLARVAGADFARTRAQFSQGGSAAPVVKGACAAVNFYSTVFLDCLAQQVPVISYDWYDFTEKKLLAEEGVFHFATDLADLRRLVTTAIAGKLPAFEKDVEPFLARTDPAEAAASFAQIFYSHSERESTS